MNAILSDNHLTLIATRHVNSVGNRTVSIEGDKEGENLPLPTARPISAGQLQAYFARVHSGEPWRTAITTLFHACFPRSLRRWYQRNPAAKLASGSIGRSEFLANMLLFAPGISPASPIDDALGPLAPWQTATTETHTEPLSLPDAIAIVIDAHGRHWYKNADAWQTADGTPPAPLVWSYAFALRAASTHAEPVRVPPPLPVDPSRSATHRFN